MQEEKELKGHIVRLINAIATSGMNLKELSRAANIPYPSLRDYAKGNKKPGLDAFASLIKACDISADWVLFGKKTENTIDPQGLGKILSLIEDKFIQGGYRDKPKGSELLLEATKVLESGANNQDIVNLSSMKKYKEQYLRDSFDKGMIAALMYNELGNINPEDESAISKAKSTIDLALNILKEAAIADKIKNN